LQAESSIVAFWERAKSKQVVTATQGMSLRAALRLMTGRGLRQLPVLDASRQVVGMLDRDSIALACRYANPPPQYLGFMVWNSKENLEQYILVNDAKHIYFVVEKIIASSEHIILDSHVSAEWCVCVCSAEATRRLLQLSASSKVVEQEHDLL
jgi:CBS-domain-containing membrane protein